MWSWNKKTQRHKSPIPTSHTGKGQLSHFSFLDPKLYCGKCSFCCTAAGGAEIIPVVPIFWIKDGFPTFSSHSQLSHVPAGWDKIPEAKFSPGDLSMSFCCWNLLEMGPQGLDSKWLCFGIFPKCLILNLKYQEREFQEIPNSSTKR